MVGAIDILKNWRKVCEKRTCKVQSYGEVRRFQLCENCDLQDLCKKNPRERTDEDILELVGKLK